ncbi:MAG: hypothetical protein DI598_01975 [Pseudopedobacter saltans]|uniref:Uncharacterized protein n=1 Tax=Pseudopedobacter saltans TaxID=151895 RepID=A0A2W5F7A0_9SPHI|nr:MAG: hypothetical protein DI598_01975 [Pseudopedobacter saltans]
MNTTPMEGSSIFERLPLPLREAQEAIELPEVQEIMKQLAKYNLGVCMPHFHNEENGDFMELQNGIIQMERDLQVRFMTQAEAKQINSVPVAWRWQDDGVTASAICVAECEIVTTPGGKDFHADRHKGGGHPYP